MIKTNPAKESTTEKKVKKYGENKGWLSRKFKSPGQKFVPDRIFIGYGTQFYIEFKAMGKKPNKGQLNEHDLMSSHGARVYVVDNIGDGYTIIDKETDNAYRKRFP